MTAVNWERIEERWKMGAMGTLSGFQDGEGPCLSIKPPWDLPPVAFLNVEVTTLIDWHDLMRSTRRSQGHLVTIGNYSSRPAPAIQKEKVLSSFPLTS